MVHHTISFPKNFNELLKTSGKLVMSIFLILTSCSEILVTTPSAGMREVYYRGAEDGSKRTKFSEWRLERVAAINKKGMHFCF